MAQNTKQRPSTRRTTQPGSTSSKHSDVVGVVSFGQGRRTAQVILKLEVDGVTRRVTRHLRRKLGGFYEDRGGVVFDLTGMTPMPRKVVQESQEGVRLRRRRR